MPAVSVVTPAFNAAAFIRHTIDSVRAQTVDDWELIVVDDGSTDATAEIVEEYRGRDARVRLLRQENRGPSASRNAGMRAARGVFIAFLDSDDTWDPAYLESQLAVFDAHPETAAVTGVARYRGGPRHGEPMRAYTPGYAVLTLGDILADDTAVFIMTIFRRTVFETIGGMDERQWRSEDYDFWLRAAAAGFVFRRNSRPLGHYSVRDGSLSRSTADMLRGMLHTYDKARQFCPEGSGERRVLDARVAAVERELLLVEAKLAIEREAFAEAAGHLRALRRRGGGPLVAMSAWLTAHAPKAAALAFRLRRRAYAARRTRTASQAEAA